MMCANPQNVMSRRSSAWMCAVVVAALAAILGGERAGAQTVPIDPIHLTVSGENVILRCCPWSFGYPVGYLSRGQVVLADGRTDIAFRIQYPDTVPALVDVEDVTYDEANGVATLIKESRLNAYNVSKNSPESWKSLLNRGLDIGTELTVLEPVKDANGVVTGFLVMAPEGARGYVDQQFVRVATQEEIVAYRRGPLPPGEEEVLLAETTTETVDEAMTTDAPATAEAPEMETTLTPIETADAGGADDAEMIEEAATETVAVDDSATDDAIDAELMEEPAPLDTIAASMEEEQDGDGESIEMTEVEIEERPIPTRQQLDESFDALLEVDILEAEIEPLIGEHRRLHGATPDTEDNVSLRNYLLARIELLQIRLDVQQDMLELARLENSAEMGTEEMQLRIAALNRRPEYVVVGRLLTSTLYDGRRLPRMYRLESIDANAGRTIAYVMPSGEVDLDGALGMIVGVVGERQLDSNLRLSVIRPTRVDRLTLGE